jgi:hypothetical protein
MKNTNHLKIGAILFLAITAFSNVLHPAELLYKIIDNPKPTMQEGNYIPLVKVNETSEELGNDKFLFFPFSFAVDKKGNLYIYDKGQTSIIKLDKDLKYVASFGRRGVGPGEFLGGGRADQVFLSVGLDGNIYANDNRGFKVLVFSPEGTFLREHRLKSSTFFEPVTDTSGNIILHSTNNGILSIINEKLFLLYQYGTRDQSIEHLYYAPTLAFSRKGRYRFLNVELTLITTPDSTLLVYFTGSAILHVVKNKKEIRKIKIWPKEALQAYKKTVDNINQKNMFVPMFLRAFPDGDDEKKIFFQFTHHKQKRINCLYRINIKGQLEDILYVDFLKNESEAARTFHWKQNGLYYAMENDKIVIYKEGHE